MRFAVKFVLVTFAISAVNGTQFSVSSTPDRHHRHTSPCLANITHDRVLLKRVSVISKYIFTGKVHGVNTENTTRVYKVNIRRVLKGDLNDIGITVGYGKAASLLFSDATILVQSSIDWKCRPLRVRTYAIFLTEKNRGSVGNPVRLKLVVEPVLLTLRNIEIIEAAIKGEDL
ncbi:uncharacterized protein LOC123689633 [Pieris rapae]|uniref:uncharacterized protein LOC123689633 n=1 Tax=Pieris rapae TaxID=64459 RepID=UPI001E27D7B3|nr:uncharacterized protein LOC123689633 [Pieris rapae]